MLENLDTLIAFVVIMSVASLLVTIVVQTLSAVSSLRGRQLLRGLQHAADTLTSDGTKAGKELAEELLKKNPAVCFAWWDRLKDAVRPEEIYESLKTLAAVSEEALTEKQKEVDAAKTTAETARNDATNTPDDAEKAKKANSAEKTYASLLAELVALKELPCRNPEDKTSPNQQAANLLAALIPAAKDPAATKDALGGLLKVVGDACLTGDDRKKLEAEIQKASQSMVEEVVTLKKSVENWFNQAVDHAQDWFLTWIRAITIAVGVLMAFAFQWDAVEIFKQVSGPNNALRKALVEKRAVVIEKGEAILNVSEVGGGLLERLQKVWNEKHTPKLETLNGIKNISEMEGKIVGLVKDVSTEEAKPEADKEAKAKDSKVTAATPQQVADKATLMKEANKAKAKTDFNNLLSEEEKSYLKSQKETFDSLAKEVSLNGFELIPKNGWRWKKEQVESPSPGIWNWIISKLLWFGGVLKYYFWDQFAHLPGMLIFAALLGLGAPFWFNLLKNLSDLRPALAKLLDASSDKTASSPAK
jgi:hypothetical protein